ncbi:hypothetical protein PP175_27745 (plasmid) [Aneurinibacillus sp. Ricciae_BoGa-3]|uniref:hypothetical protein n=1 Tax=Aneurinibacillus sp. Ricciae_BoGa-3 TaxID=3022697 RepID=UPI00234057DD|nr:hypothetical protein [Aneurinibacillus sp. Ricciae_BoGa-3]WCK56987.1 hypothetical protein PP175_27745 [Aneurinibacillus sp. Ricciae_BoGa-3]
MIIAKGAKEFNGYIEYSYGFDSINRFIHGVTEDDEEAMFERDTFHSLEEFLNKISQETLDKIKKEFGADRAWVSCISFKVKSEDGDTNADISLFENNKVRGIISTKIDNNDITARALLNIMKIKEIADNTIDEFPIKH